MSNENHRVAKYQYELIQDSISGRPREVTLLFLFDEQREMLCNIAFLPDDEAAIKATQSSGGAITAQMPLSYCDRILDMLRNEKPVHFSWSADSQSIRLSTLQEPVGEQELRKMFSFLYI